MGANLLDPQSSVGRPTSSAMQCCVGQSDVVCGCMCARLHASNVSHSRVWSFFCELLDKLEASSKKRDASECKRLTKRRSPPCTCAQLGVSAKSAHAGVGTRHKGNSLWMVEIARQKSNCLSTTLQISESNSLFAQLPLARLCMHNHQLDGELRGRNTSHCVRH